MSEEKKIAVTEEVKEARELSEEELEQVTGGGDTTSSLLWCRTCNAKVHCAAGPIIDGVPYVVCNNCGGLIPNAF